MWSLFNGSLGFIGVLSKLLKLDFFDNFFRYDLKESVFFFFSPLSPFVFLCHALLLKVRVDVWSQRKLRICVDWMAVVLVEGLSILMQVGP